MLMKLLRKKRFLKSYLRLPKTIQIKVDRTLLLFSKNPRDQKLRNHALAWILRHFRSIDVTWDIRIIFRECSDGSYELVELIDVWSHSQLYW